MPACTPRPPQEQLAAQRADAEAASARSLQLLDRAMAAKDELAGGWGGVGWGGVGWGGWVVWGGAGGHGLGLARNIYVLHHKPGTCPPAADGSFSAPPLPPCPPLPAARCAQLSGELGALQAEAGRQVEALKQGLARELRRQKVGRQPGAWTCAWSGPASVAAATCTLCRPPAHPPATHLPTLLPPTRFVPPAQELWVAAERSKREAWMAEQARAIRERTVRGLEPEIQVGWGGVGGWVPPVGGWVGGWVRDRAGIAGGLWVGQCIHQVGSLHLAETCAPHRPSRPSRPSTQPPTALHSITLQRLVESHKAELRRAEQRHEAETARRLAAATAAAEEAAAAARAAAAADRERAVEAERASARDQVKDAQAR